MKKALVLAGGLPQIELLKELKSRNYYTILADYFENPIAKDFADKFYRESTLDIAAIRNIAKNENIDLIITCCTDQALTTVAKISEELGLNCYIDYNTTLNVTNKQYMKTKMYENNIPTAKFKIVDNIDEKIDMKFPLVVKPVDCNSSKGVYKVYNDLDLKNAVSNALTLSRTNTAIVEEFISGDEISVDAFIVNGKAKILCYSNSEKILDDNKFVIYKGIYPAEINSTDLKNIEKILQDIVNAFNIDNCPLLVQLLKKNGNIYVVEFSARTGGCAKYKMIELASGIDIIKYTVDCFENKSINIAPHLINGIVVNEFIYCKEGVFDHLENFDKCVEDNMLYSYDLLKTKGSKTSSACSSGDRIAAITYLAESKKDYICKHNKVIDLIKVIDNNGEDIMMHELLPKL